MKYKCLKSIQVPIGVGRFSAFEAGREYEEQDIPEGALSGDGSPSPSYFVPVEAEADAPKPSPKAKKEVKGDGN